MLWMNLGVDMVDFDPAGEFRVSTQRLMEYWAHGEGAAKVAWGSPGDFNRCVRHLSKYVGPGIVKGLCAKLHHRALGVWPGREHGKD